MNEEKLNLMLEKLTQEQASPLQNEELDAFKQQLKNNLKLKKDKIIYPFSFWKYAVASICIVVGAYLYIVTHEVDDIESQNNPLTNLSKPAEDYCAIERDSKNMLTSEKVDIDHPKNLAEYLMVYPEIANDTIQIQLLIEYGVDPTGRALNGQTALDIAKSKKNTSLIEFLESLDSDSK